MTSYAKARRAAPPEPKREALEYTRWLDQVVLDAYKQGLRSQGKRLRLDGIGSDLLDMINDLEQVLRKKFLPLFSRIVKRNNASWQAVLNVPLSENAATQGVFDLWVKQNTDLIVNLTDFGYKRAADTVAQATTKGLSQAELRKQIQDGLGVAKSRASLIARDQTLKVNAQITAANHQYAGISRFEWVTSGDERVRDSHARLNGTIWDYSRPPSIGLPGTDFQCRCIAYPVVEGLSGLPALR